MTRNLGVEHSEPAGFGAEQGAEDFTRASRQAFRPELFNRIDHIIPFRLTEADVPRIVDLELQKAASRAGLSRRGLKRRWSRTRGRGWPGTGMSPNWGTSP